jgi:NADH-quinone oxidoreductase subunit E
MITEQVKQEINAELAHCLTKQAASVEALRIVQKHHGWVSDENLRETAAHLDMTTAELDAVATFYNFIYRKPVGKHVIVICDSISCWVMGYEPLKELLEKKLGIGFGGTTADNRFTLLPASCLGACDRAPVMMVDDDLYGPVTAEMMDTILETYN